MAPELVTFVDRRVHLREAVAAQVGELASRPEFQPRYVTAESRERRHLCLTERRRATSLALRN